MNATNPGESALHASLKAALADAEWSLEQLPLNDSKRGELARRIRAIEDALDRVGDGL